MDFKQRKNGFKLGKRIGFIFSYFLFTTIAYFIFKLTGKIGNWTYYHFMVLVLLITLLGLLIKRMLK